MQNFSEQNVREGSKSSSEHDPFQRTPEATNLGLEEIDLGLPEIAIGFQRKALALPEIAPGFQRNALGLPEKHLV